MRVSINRTYQAIKAVVSGSSHAVFFRSSDNVNQSYMLLDGAISLIDRSLEDVAQESKDLDAIFMGNEITLTF